jgi:hypothetical protein
MTLTHCFPPQVPKPIHRLRRRLCVDSACSGSPLRRRLQPCLGLLLIALLSAARADEVPARRDAPPASSLEPSKTLILLDYQRVAVQGDAPIDLLGSHFVRQVNDWLFLGLGVQAPLVSGNYGGFATFDIGAYAKKHLGSRVFATAGLFGGAGAGGRSVENAKTLSGNGTLTRAFVGLGYDFSNVSVGVNVSKLKIRGAAIGGTQANVFLEVPYSVLTGPFALHGQPLMPADASWAQSESGPSMLTLGADNFRQIHPQGSRKQSFSTADLQYSHFFLEDTYWFAGLGIGYRGLPTYNQFLGGIGHRLRLSQRLALYGQLGVGSGGYAPEVIDTGPGLVLFPKLAAEYAVTRNIGVSLTAGYMAAARGSSRNASYGLALTRHIGVSDRADTPDNFGASPTYRGVRFGLYQLTAFGVRYAGVDRGTLPMLGIQGDLVIDDHWYVPLQAAAAYRSYLGYPGYDEVLAGIGLQSHASPADRLQVFAQAMAGANLHGRAAKVSLGTRVILSDSLSLSLVAGRTAAQSASGNRFSANSVAVGLETRFSFPGW